MFVYNAPYLQTGKYNPFVIERVFNDAGDETTYVDWSFDSKLLAVGAKDNLTRLYCIERVANFRSYILGSHSDVIVGCYFEKDNYDVTSISMYANQCCQ